jgi:tetratricopeptide (TPR) repeat protein
LCLELGKAQVGLQGYREAALYLACANILAREHPSAGFLLHVTAERGVLAFLSGSSREFDALLTEVLRDSRSAEQVAAMTFKEGIKNARWADEQGRRFPETLKLANAQLRMSLELNKRLNVQQAVGVALCELGDVHKHLGKRQEARKLYEESLRVLTPLGNAGECGAIRERMKNL